MAMDSWGDEHGYDKAVWKRNNPNLVSEFGTWSHFAHTVTTTHLGNSSSLTSIKRKSPQQMFSWYNGTEICNFNGQSDKMGEQLANPWTGAEGRWRGRDRKVEVKSLFLKWLVFLPVVLFLWREAPGFPTWVEHCCRRHQDFSDTQDRCRAVPAMALYSHCGNNGGMVVVSQTLPQSTHLYTRDTPIGSLSVL